MSWYLVCTTKKKQLRKKQLKKLYFVYNPCIMSWRSKFDKPIKLSDLQAFDKKSLKPTTTSIRHRDGSITTETLSSTDHSNPSSSSSSSSTALPQSTTNSSNSPNLTTMNSPDSIGPINISSSDDDDADNQPFYPTNPVDLLTFKRKAFCFDSNYERWQNIELQSHIKPMIFDELSIASIMFEADNNNIYYNDSLSPEFSDLMNWLKRIQPSVMIFGYLNGYHFRYLMQLDWIRKYYQSSDTELGTNTSQWRSVIFSKLNIINFECSLLFSPWQHTNRYFEKSFLINTKVRVQINNAQIGQRKSLSLHNRNNSSINIQEKYQTSILNIMYIKYDRNDKLCYSLQLQQIFKHLKKLEIQQLHAKNEAENDEKESGMGSGGMGGSSSGGGGGGGYAAIINGSDENNIEKLASDNHEFDCLLVGPMCDMVQMIPNDKFSSFRHCERLLKIEEMSDDLMESKEDLVNNSADFVDPYKDEELEEILKYKKLISLSQPICNIMKSSDWQVAMIEEWDWLKDKERKSVKKLNLMPSISDFGNDILNKTNSMNSMNSIKSTSDNESKNNNNDNKNKNEESKHDNDNDNGNKYKNNNNNNKKDSNDKNEKNNEEKKNSEQESKNNSNVNKNINTTNNKNNNDKNGSINNKEENGKAKTLEPRKKDKNLCMSRKCDCLFHANCLYLMQC